MKVLVTGADGFVGQWLVQALLGAGHEVTGAVRDGRPIPGRQSAAELAAVRWVPLDLQDAASIDAVAREEADWVVHLAAVASSVEAGRDLAVAWAVNAAGTARLVESLASHANAERVVVVSTGEVYGPGEPRPRRETDPVRPVSPYAATKAAAEIAALEAGRRTGLAVMVARAFPHTGPGQTTTYVAPAFLDRIRIAQRTGAVAVKTGNLDPVRELLDVRDVVEAYIALLERGRAGEVYNVARGEGIAIGDLFTRLADAAGVRVLPEPDPSLMRTTDVLHLVGDPAKITSETAWTPRRSIDQTLLDLVNAQAH